MYDIPTETYSEFHKLMPIICVDVIVGIEDKLLLIQRKCEPMKDSWWFPGGRLLRGEDLTQAVSRVVKAETGLTTARYPTYLGFGETKFNEDPFQHGKGTHTVNFVYATNASALSVMQIVLDSNHIAHSTFSFEEIYTSNMHPYVKRFTALAEGILRK